jgi:hypothetical protein
MKTLVSVRYHNENPYPHVGLEKEVEKGSYLKRACRNLIIVNVIKMLGAHLLGRNVVKFESNMVMRL